MLVCPTSLFPICPSGSPTASPLVCSCETGNRSASLSRFGVPCSRMAFPSRRAEFPQPSRMTSSAGRICTLVVAPGQQCKSGRIDCARGRPLRWRRFPHSCSARHAMVHLGKGGSVLAPLFLLLAVAAPAQRFVDAHPASSTIRSADGRLLVHASGFLAANPGRTPESAARNFLSTHGG